MNDYRKNRRCKIESKENTFLMKMKRHRRIRENWEVLDHEHPRVFTFLLPIFFLILTILLDVKRKQQSSWPRGLVMILSMRAWTMNRTNISSSQFYLFFSIWHVIFSFLHIIFHYLHPLPHSIPLICLTFKGILFHPLFTFSLLLTYTPPHILFPIQI